MTALEAQAVLPSWPALMSSGTAAAYLDTSETTFRAWVRDGYMPTPIQIGGSVRWDRLEIDTMIRQLPRKGEVIKRVNEWDAA